MKKTLIGIAIIIVILLLPLIFKDKSRVPLTGPDLEELEFSEVFFNNETENIKLAGLLILPVGEGPFPVAVIIHGSGPSRRNSIWYISVAKHLQNNGIAVLLPDKRGCEKSAGKWVGTNFDLLANDTVGAVAFIKNQDRFRYTTIGLVGMSQGGWIAPVAAAKTADISFVAVISGAAVSTDEQLLHEEIHNIAPYTYTFIAKLIAPFTSAKIKKKAFFAPLVGFDPVPYWKKIQVPVFLGYGGGDKNVPVETSIKRLKENGLDKFKVKVYPGGRHGIIDPKTTRMNEEYLNDLVQFIKGVPALYRFR